MKVFLWILLLLMVSNCANKESSSQKKGTDNGTSSQTQKIFLGNLGTRWVGYLDFRTSSDNLKNYEKFLSSQGFCSIDQKDPRYAINGCYLWSFARVKIKYETDGTVTLQLFAEQNSMYLGLAQGYEPILSIQEKPTVQDDKNLSFYSHPLFDLTIQSPVEQRSFESLSQIQVIFKNKSHFSDFNSLGELWIQK